MPPPQAGGGRGGKDWFEDHFPADFIVEYVGQTRGWFYTLMVLSTALFDRIPFKNCICHGVILDAEGKKLSKKLRNYPDPNEMFDQYGADAMRWRMIKEPVMHGGNLLIRKDGNDIRDVVRLSIKPIWNAYHFFCLYANADGVRARNLLEQKSEVRSQKSKRSEQVGEPPLVARSALGSSETLVNVSGSNQTINLMDRYILAKLKETVQQIEQALDDFVTPEACKAVDDFFEVLNNWYIRRSRERFWRKFESSKFEVRSSVGIPGNDKDNASYRESEASKPSQDVAKQTESLRATNINEQGQLDLDVDKQAAYDTLYTVLVTMTKVAAPLLPLTMEEIHSGLVGAGAEQRDAA